MTSKEWRTWTSTSGITHVIEIASGGQRILYCHQAALPWLLSDDSMDQVINCLRCAAWWSPS